ncbi:MAG: hypothetical protein ACYDAD_15130 [Acidimicrobiales bacterium]
MKALIALIRAEPAVIVSLILAVLTLAGTFGLHVTDAQTGAIAAVAQILAGLVVRSQVTPTRPPVAPHT